MHSKGIVEAEDDVIGVYNRLAAVRKFEEAGGPKDKVFLHKLVQPHPHTGELAVRLEPKTCETIQMPNGEELPVWEGQRLLWQVLRRVTQSDNAYQHLWQPGDLMV